MQYLKDYDYIFETENHVYCFFSNIAEIEQVLGMAMH